VQLPAPVRHAPANVACGRRRGEYCLSWSRPLHAVPSGQNRGAPTHGRAPGNRGCAGACAIRVDTEAAALPRRVGAQRRRQLLACHGGRPGARERVAALVRELALQSQIGARMKGTENAARSSANPEPAGQPPSAFQNALQAAAMRSAPASKWAPDRTPARRNAAAATEKQRAAEEIIRSDPFVQDMMRDFGAKIVPGSIQAVQDQRPRSGSSAGPQPIKGNSSCSTNGQLCRPHETGPGHARTNLKKGRTSWPTSRSAGESGSGPGVEVTMTCKHRRQARRIDCQLAGR